MKFCWNCGIKMGGDANFCPECGAQQESNQYPSSSQMQYEYQSVHQMEEQYQPANQRGHLDDYKEYKDSKRKKSKKPIFIFLVGLLLIAISINNLALNVIGRETTARVESAVRDTRTYGSNLPEPNRYQIIYSFYVNGEKYTGSGTGDFIYGIRSDQTVRIRYLPMYPRINGTVQETNIIGNIILFFLGWILMVGSIKKRIPIGRKHEIVFK